MLSKISSALVFSFFLCAGLSILLLPAYGTVGIFMLALSVASVLGFVVTDRLSRTQQYNQNVNDKQNEYNILRTRLSSQKSQALLSKFDALINQAHTDIHHRLFQSPKVDVFGSPRYLETPDILFTLNWIVKKARRILNANETQVDMLLDKTNTTIDKYNNNPAHNTKLKRKIHNFYWHK